MSDINESLKRIHDLMRVPDDGRFVTRYYDRENDEFKALTKENIKELIREVLAEEENKRGH